MSFQDEHADADASIDGMPSSAREEGATSLSRMLNILDLFTVDAPVWATPDIMEAISATRSTSYRYIKALNEAGLLSAVGNGHYILGPRIIEMDLQIRRNDPLLRAGEGVLEELVSVVGHTALQCMLYRSSVLCIRRVLAPLSRPGIIDRGQKRSLFKGSLSKVILAHLPNYRLRNVFERNQEEISEGGIGGEWPTFRANLTAIRKKGFAVSHGEVVGGALGISAPVFNRDGLILGSVGVSVAQDEISDVDQRRIVMAVKRAGREVTRRMIDDETGTSLPPRAVG